MMGQQFFVGPVEVGSVRDKNRAKVRLVGGIGESAGAKEQNFDAKKID